MGRVEFGERKKEKVVVEVERAVLQKTLGVCG